MGIQEPIGVLTAVHFHAGFATAMIAAATLQFAESRGKVQWLRWVIALVIGMPYGEDSLIAENAEGARGIRGQIFQPRGHRVSSDRISRLRIEVKIKVPTLRHETREGWGTP
jgi:hypothetical protein